MRPHRALPGRRSVPRGTGPSVLIGSLTFRASHNARIQHWARPRHRGGYPVLVLLGCPDIGRTDATGLGVLAGRLSARIPAPGAEGLPLGISLPPGLRVSQYLPGGEDRRGHERNQVQRIAWPGVHHARARCAFYLHGGAVGCSAAEGRHQPVDPDLTDPAAESVPPRGPAFRPVTRQAGRWSRGISRGPADRDRTQLRQIDDLRPARSPER